MPVGDDQPKPLDGAGAIGFDAEPFAEVGMNAGQAAASQRIGSGPRRQVVAVAGAQGKVTVSGEPPDGVIGGSRGDRMRHIG